MTRKSLIARIGDIFDDIGRAHHAAQVYERLAAMSDAQLAARGLKRGDLPAAVVAQAFGR